MQIRVIWILQKFGFLKSKIIFFGQKLDLKNIAHYFKSPILSKNSKNTRFNHEHFLVKVEGSNLDVSKFWQNLLLSFSMWAFSGTVLDSTTDVSIFWQKYQVLIPFEHFFWPIIFFRYQWEYILVKVFKVEKCEHFLAKIPSGCLIK